MSRNVYRDTKKYTISWDAEIGAVVHRWNEFASGEDYREGCEALLDAIEERNASKLLVDTSGIRAHDDADQAWLMEEWLPRSIEAGVTSSATVHPDSVIAEMDIEDMMEKADDTPYEPFVTNDLDEAREWIATQ